MTFDHGDNWIFLYRSISYEPIFLQKYHSENVLLEICNYFKCFYVFDWNIFRTGNMSFSPISIYFICRKMECNSTIQHLRDKFWKFTNDITKPWKITVIQIIFKILSCKQHFYLLLAVTVPQMNNSLFSALFMFYFIPGVIILPTYIIEIFIKFFLKRTTGVNLVMSVHMLLMKSWW